MSEKFFNKARKVAKDIDRGTYTKAVEEAPYHPGYEDAVVDNVNNPKHYTSHPSGIDCIQITEHMGFCLGNAMKYVWRADLKGDAIEDLEKAVWYIRREIERRKREN